MPHDIDAERTLVHEATTRLVRTVDSLTDEAFVQPSGLPGWSRGHVVAHLVLNAEALAGVLRGIQRGEPTPMYPSQERRDGDIAELAAAGPSVLRDRLLGSTTDFDDAVAAMPHDAWSTAFERTPGGQTIVAAAVLDMRLREVEIHHVDLDAGHTPADWSPAFCRLLLDSMVKRGSATSFVMAPTDLDGDWPVGPAGAEAGPSGPTISGPAAALGWWLTGRGTGDGLTSSDGRLPQVSPW